MINQLDGFVDECKNRFGENISGLLYYGSSSRNVHNPFSDQDLLMTVREYDIGLMLELNQLIRSVTFFLDIPVVFESEIPHKADNFRLINHGCYFLEILKLGRVIYGRNVFLDLPSPSSAAISQSLFDTIVEYAQFFRRNFVESNRERSLATNYQLNRRLIKAALDLLWIVHGQPQQSTVLPSLLTRALDGGLNQAQQAMIIQLADPEQAELMSGNLSDTHALTRFEIMEKIYFVAQRHTNPSLLR